MLSRDGHAGASSQRRYNDLVRAWRRRNRGLFISLTLICGFALVASFIAAQRWPGSGWLFGLLGGAGLTFWVVARLTPPGWIENWQSGAWGEVATAKTLRQVEREGWVVLHDLRAGRGNVDHIVVGPGGVFLLDSKRWGGTVEVGPDGITVRRPDDPDLSYRHPGGGHLLSLARQTHERVLAGARIRIWVTPVMVLWSEFPQRVVRDRCVYVHGAELVDWLRAQQQTIAPNRVEQIATAVRAGWLDAAKDPSTA